MSESIHPNVSVTHEQIAAFCRKWDIVRFELFGSVLRDDFTPESDIDVMVTFGHNRRLNLHDWLDMREELGELFGRPVDVVERELIEASRNPYRRHHILKHNELIYVA